MGRVRDKGLGNLLEYHNKSILLNGLILLVVFLGLLVLVIWMNGKAVISHEHDWTSFYQQTVHHYFDVPLDARVIKAQEIRDRGPMAAFGLEFRVTLKLPSSKPPAAWVAEIARKSGINKRWKRTDGSYREAESSGDYRFVHYNSDQSLYELGAAWD